MIEFDVYLLSISTKSIQLIRSLPTSTTSNNVNIIKEGFRGFYKVIMLKMSWSHVQSWVSKTLKGNWQVGNAETKMSGESYNSNTCENLNIIVLVDMQFLGMLLLSLQTLLHTI